MGFHMPAEWHPHEATWLSWPTNEETWPGSLDAVRASYRTIIREVGRGEIVRLLVDDEPTRFTLAEEFPKEVADGRLELYVLPTVDGWIRDYGPNFLVNPETGKVAFNNWKFNAWGGKYEDLARDDDVPGRIEPILGLSVFTPGMVLEGGSIDVNGAGLCLTTRQCLLNPNRNPELDQAGIEEMLRLYLGVREILWLEEGIVGDDTDGHIDDIARFVAEDVVLCCVETDPLDDNYAILEDNYRRLKSISEARGWFRVEALPMPDPVLAEGWRLPASYANFLIANSVVVVPTFGQKKDRIALAKLERLFPGRRVVGVPSTEMVYGLGSVHCLSQQQPVP